MAIGSTCDRVPPLQAFAIGLAAGLLSTVGSALVQERLPKALGLVDTCGVLYLHRLPGLLGGLATLVGVAGVDGALQLKGIAISFSPVNAASPTAMGKRFSLSESRPVHDVARPIPSPFRQSP